MFGRKTKKHASVSWTLDMLNLDLVDAAELAGGLDDVAPHTSALMHTMIGFNQAVANSPVGPDAAGLFEEVSQLEPHEVGVLVALILDTAQQADEILDNAALGDHWLPSHHHDLLDDAKGGIEAYGEALTKIVNLVNADDED